MTVQSGRLMVVGLLLLASFQTSETCTSSGTTLKTPCV